jgi:hypothetical protein
MSILDNIMKVLGYVPISTSQSYNVPNNIIGQLFFRLGYIPESSISKPTPPTPPSSITYPQPTPQPTPPPQPITTCPTPPYITPSQLKVSMQNNYTQLIVTGPSSLKYWRLLFYDPQTDTVSTKATYTACYGTMTSWGASMCMVGPITQDLDHMNSPNNGYFYDNGNGTATAYLDLMGQLVTTNVNNVTKLCLFIGSGCSPKNFCSIGIQLIGIAAYPPGNCTDIGCKGTVQVQLVKRCLMVAPNEDNNYTPCNQRTIIQCVPLNYNCHCPL